MDITPPNRPNPALRKDTLPALKPGQVIEAKVLGVGPQMRTLTLELAGKIVQAQSNLPVKLSDGAALKLVLIRLQPVPEFKILTPSQQAPSGKSIPADQPLLQIKPADGQNPAPVQPTPAPQKTAAGQAVLTAKVMAITGDQLELQLVNEANAPKAGDSFRIPLSRAAALTLQPGQLIVLSAQPETAAGLASVSGKLLRQYLPIHESPVRLLEQLLKTLPALQRSERMPTELKRLAEQILRNLPRLSALMQSASVKQAADRAGIFLEAELSHPQTAKASGRTNEDFKASLLKLTEALKQVAGGQAEVKLTAPEQEQLSNLLQKAESGLAKIVLDQLTSLPKEQGSQQLWHLEIPFLHQGEADSVKLAIERDNSGPEREKTATWSVTITVAPPVLGKLQCKVSYLHGAVNVRFRSTNAEVVELIERHLDTLKQHLEASGLAVNYMDATPGEPIEPKLHGRVGEKLLDEKV